MADADDALLRKGDRVDHHRGQARLGGFAEVYKGRHAETGQVVALKMLHEEAALDRQVRRSREAAVHRHGAPEEAVPLFIDVTLALARAHDAGMLGWLGWTTLAAK